MESFDVSQENFLGDTNIKSEDEVKRYWMEEFYEKKSRLKLFFERVWYWFVVFLTGILLIGIPVVLTMFVVNFLPVLLFHMLVEDVILFGVLSTFCGSLVIIGGYYLASVLFSYADKLNDRNNRDNHIDVEKRSPIQRILAGCGFLSFVVATMVVLICLVTFYIDIAAIILLVFLAACCSSDSHCFICVNCSGGFNVFGLWQSINRPAEAAQCCWNIAVHGRSSLETREKNYDTLEKLYLRRLEKIFFIRSMTDRKILKAMISHYIQQDSEFEKLLDKLGDKMYKEGLEQQSRFIVLKYKIMPLIVKLADKTDKSADEIFAYENVLMSNFNIFDDNQRINKNNTTSEMYSPAPSAQNTSKPISNVLNNDKDEVKLLKKELLLVIETSNYLFGAFNQPNDVLKQMFEGYRNKCGYDKIRIDILDNEDVSKNINIFNTGNRAGNNGKAGNDNANNRYPSWEQFDRAQGKFIDMPSVDNGVGNNNSDVNLPSLEEIERAKKNEANVSLSESIANAKSKFENNNLNNRYPSFDEFLETQKL